MVEIDCSLGRGSSVPSLAEDVAGDNGRWRSSGDERGGLAGGHCEVRVSRAPRWLETYRYTYTYGQIAAASFERAL